MRQILETLHPPMSWSSQLVRHFYSEITHCAHCTFHSVATSGGDHSHHHHYPNQNHVLSSLSPHQHSSRQTAIWQQIESAECKAESQLTSPWDILLTKAEPNESSESQLSHHHLPTMPIKTNANFNNAMTQPTTMPPSPPMIDRIDAQLFKSQNMLISSVN